MQLGEIVARLNDETIATEALLDCGDLSLVVEVSEVAGRFEETPGDYAAGSVRRFANAASDEDWLALMTALERTDDPARTCLVNMVAWSLARDRQPIIPAPEPGAHACSCGGGQGCGT
jgi:hypothetical protein